MATRFDALIDALASNVESIRRELEANEFSGLIMTLREMQSALELHPLEDAAVADQLRTICRQYPAVRQHLPIPSKRLAGSPDKVHRDEPISGLVDRPVRQRLSELICLMSQLQADGLTTFGTGLQQQPNSTEGPPE